MLIIIIDKSNKQHPSNRVIIDIEEFNKLLFIIKLKLTPKLLEVFKIEFKDAKIATKLKPKANIEKTKPASTFFFKFCTSLDKYIITDNLLE